MDAPGTSRLFGIAMFIAFCACRPALTQIKALPCASQPARVDVQEEKNYVSRFAVPPQPNAWRIQLETQGGYSGSGLGTLSVTSRGDAVLEGRGFNRNQKVDAGQALPSAVSAAHPETWHACYILPPAADGREDGCCDQFRYTLSIGVRGSSGQKQIYRVSWYDDDASLLPTDFRAITKELFEIRKAAMSGDRVTPSSQPKQVSQKIEGGSADISLLHFKLLTERTRFILQVDVPEGEKKLTIQRDWLVPPDRSVDADYVSSDLYSKEVTSFPIGNGKIGLHLSSFDSQTEGSAAAAAGRDVFLIYDVKSSTLARGNLHLGITKQRLRDSGCLTAEMNHFLLADVNRDGLTDIGVIKENIFCGPEDSEGIFGAQLYEQHPVRWYVYTAQGWKEDVHYSGEIPEKYSELPLVGIVLGTVDFFASMIWENYDPAKWKSPGGKTPRFVPAYRRELMLGHEGK
jgi:hypothetical protein